MRERVDSAAPKPEASADIFEVCRSYQEPSLVRAAGIYPYFHVLSESDGPLVTLNGREIVMLGANNYLGLAHHPEVREAAHAALDRYGTGCTGSRFLNGNLELHEQLEEDLAAFTGKDAALVFASGFLANAGVIAAMGNIDGAVILSERENHASLIDGARMARGRRHVFSNLTELEELLSTEQPGRTMVVTDAVFSMTGRIADLRSMVDLKRRHVFRLYVDDAHGLGVLGPRGAGTAASQGVNEEVDLLFGTFSKALASLGGFVAGETAVIDYLRHKARTIIFSAALPPASVAAAIAALRVLRTDAEIHKRLAVNTNMWREGLRRIGYYTMGSTTPIVPVFVGSESLAFRMCKDLLELGVFATPVAYPAVPYGQALIRTTTMASHCKSQLDKALLAFESLAKKYPLKQIVDDELPVASGIDFTYAFPPAHGASKA